MTSYDDNYYEYLEEQWNEAIDEGTDAVLPILQRIPGATIDRSALRDIIEIAHQADDPEWSFNSSRLIEELIQAASPADIDWQDMEPLYDSLESDLDELFPLRV